MKTFGRTLGFMLVAGAVGPIFLILYFVAGEGVSWLLWTGLAVIVLDVVGAVGLTVTSVRGRPRRTG
ncbi:hypothetical protein ACFOJ6_14680 [Gordonia humi]